MSNLFAMFGLPGPVELLLLGGVILLLFGNRLPSTMRSLGRGLVEFKKGMHDDTPLEEEAESKST